MRREGKRKQEIYGKKRDEMEKGEERRGGKLNVLSQERNDTVWRLTIIREMN